MKKSLLFIILSGFVACYRIPPGEHGWLMFENNSDNTVYVTEHVAKNMDALKSIPFSGSKKSHTVNPHEINNEAIPLGYNLTYESYVNYYGRVLIFVFPEYYDYSVSWERHKIVSYELSLEDFVSLDFHLYYPPNEKMKNIKMDPPFETFVHE